jgi:hypothetical protein
MRFSFCTALIISLFSSNVVAQSLNGKISEVGGEVIPFATVYIKEIRLGTTSNDFGFYEIKLQPGTYTVIYQSIGFETVQDIVTISEGANRHNVTMKVKSYEIPTVRITPNMENPAYAIMRRAIGMAPYYQNQVSSFKAEVYLKGSMKIKKLAWIVRKMADKDELPKIGVVYLSESLNNVAFTAPNTFKQEVKYVRSNFPNSDGDDPMGFINANFYEPKVGEIILPLAPYAFNHYIFKYEGCKLEGDVMVNKIKVTPRRKSKQLVEGYIYIADNFWNLHGLDLTVENLVGTIHMRQNFAEVDKNIWLPISHYFEIAGKFMGNEGDVKYTASVKYKEVKENKLLKPPTSFPEVKVAMAEAKKEKPSVAVKPKTQKKAEKRQVKMQSLMEKETLSNREMYELSKLMAQEAKEKDTTQKTLEIKSNREHIKVDSLARTADTTLWQQIRPVALTSEEQQGFSINPSSKIAVDSAKVKRDSVAKGSSFMNDLVFGKVWREKQNRFEYSGLITPTELRFNTVDGFVAGMYFSYRRSISTGYFEIKPSAAYAFNRKVIMGTLETKLSYSPVHRGLLEFSGGRSSTDFNRETGISILGNSIASLFFRENYMKLYEHRVVEAKNSIDIVNGFEFSSGIAYYDRQELSNNTDFAFVDNQARSYTSNLPLDTIPSELVHSHRAVIAQLGFRYTPEYYYRMRGNQKIMVRSDYPTLWAKIKVAGPSNRADFASFASAEGGLFQTIRSGAGNEFSYSLSYGDFLSRNSLYFADYKHFNTQEIPVVVGDFANSYQLLNYYNRSTNSAWATGFVKYESPFLFLKYLPLLSNRMWKEDLYGSWLYTKGRHPYYEVGYGMTQIGLFGGVGVFVGFEGQKFSQVGLKACFTFRNEISL